MRLTTLLAATAIALTANLAHAQPAQPLGDADERLRLAHQLYELSGGRAAAEAQIRSTFAMTSRVAVANMPPNQSRFATALQQDMQDEVLRMIPSVLEVGERAFADNLTTQELRDYVAWLTSDSGRAVLAKTSAIRDEILAREAPLMAQMIPDMQRRVAAHVCAQMTCDAAQRQMIDDAMARAYPKP
ncbi:MAG TPA: DUF2059 domain-containing protein [Caulobacteraceae bacterium]|nr:DUF2059 domain-containing protein [Caulobacteraceae bacterium]